MERPFVSVLMTTYNHGSYLAKAIESVLQQQTSFAFELILGEDCSTDHTLSICHQYVERYPDKVRLITSDHNVGWRANYRRTFEAARGRYVAYCDGDDWWCDVHKLAKQVEWMEAHADCGLCHTRVHDFMELTREMRPDPEKHYDDFDHLLLRLTIANCSTLARRDLVAQYYEEVKPQEHPEWLTDDQPMWLWVAAHSKVHCLEDFMVVHRCLPDSVSHSQAHLKRIAFCDSLMDASLWMEERYGTGRMKFKILRKRCSVALWSLSYEGTVGEYLHRWWEDVKRTPRLALCPEGAGLLVKKILFRRKKHNV